MKILVFTEGTALMPSSFIGLSREERVKLAQADDESVSDFTSYIPDNTTVAKLQCWKDQGAEIYYLTSRKSKDEIEIIKNILQHYAFPDAQNLLFRMEGQEYKDVAEELMPDMLIEDDCESIGGEKEMTYPHIRPELQTKIKSVVVKEFAGIDSLPEDSTKL